MQSWGEILCENGTKTVIALKYIMRLQPPYTRTLWNHPISYEVIKKESLQSTTHSQATGPVLQPRVTSPSCKVAVREKLGPSAFSSFPHLLGTDVLGERGAWGAVASHSLCPAHQQCLQDVYDPVTAKQYLLCLLLAGQQKLLPPIDIAGNWLFSLCKQELASKLQPVFLLLAMGSDFQLSEGGHSW